MKITGAELLDFIKHGWPSDDYYWEHDCFEDNPDGNPLPTETYDTEDFGPLLWQGHAPDPTRGEGLDLDKVIRLWRRDRDSRTVIIRLPNAVSDKDIRAALKPLKGTIER